MVEKQEQVCVTGGGGYQASWLVKLLLSKGYMVYATDRDPGTSYILKVCSMENVRRLVIVSSISAVIKTCRRQSMDESSWSNKESLQTTKYGAYSWYYISKTIAESQALEYAKKTGLEVVTVCPSIIIGSM
ncbi:Cinnamoyl-coa reductase [Thalictrum thalictroides]|uniref:Cinnamoyl-coa reductase n=1 Tax=Thalictrum thalictroides TaxID=46969 RepID=A0A7J6VJR0_THATH|nr:Cinnamoyl-coa reductase [Thalictrum thalictroides]